MAVVGYGDAEGGFLCLSETLQQITQFRAQTVTACRSKCMELEKSLHDALNPFSCVMAAGTTRRRRTAVIN
jgi:hypothetical protein